MQNRRPGTRPFGQPDLDHREFRRGIRSPYCSTWRIRLPRTQSRTRVSRGRGVHPQVSIHAASCLVGLCIDPSPLQRESSGQDSSTSGRVSPRFRKPNVSVPASAGIGDLWLVLLNVADRQHHGLDREHVPTAGEIVHPCGYGYRPCCAKYPRLYKRASFADSL